jgi:hypothetical protein
VNTWEQRNGIFEHDPKLTTRYQGILGVESIKRSQVVNVDSRAALEHMGKITIEASKNVREASSNLDLEGNE